MAAAKRRDASVEFNAIAQMAVLGLAALLLDFLPIFSAILGLLETYFHELGHAVAAQLTGRTAMLMELNWNGSGLVKHKGSIEGLAWIARSITAWWGYAAAIAFGTLFYWLMTIAEVRGRVVLWFFAGVVAISMVWLARDLTTWLIGGLLTATLTVTGFALKWTVGDHLQPGKLLVRFIGISLIVLSMKSAWALWSIEPPHDAATLASTTFIFQFMWILSWELFGLACLFFLFKRELKFARQQATIAESRRRTRPIRASSGG